ncbi:nicotinate (nicotinamide) nucleotide adenylyltransferase [Sulfurimonas sp.]|nr:nicotinate (nicotinamide) nucleotide adenylyltransferase [Sulfurimonas sp.]
METIALFGGSFDPPHIGHKKIVDSLEKFDYIDKTIVVPTFLNPFKSTFVNTPKRRFEMLKEMFEDYKYVEISDYEINQKKKVPSIESVKHFLKTYKKIYLVIGADNLASLEKWYNYNELKKLVTFIVATRDDIEIPKEFITLHVDEKISSTQIRKKGIK